MVLKKERPPFRARDDAHHHPGAYTFSSAKSAKTHVGDAVNHYTPHPRACACRCSLFRERESDFSPTNQPTNQPTVEGKRNIPHNTNQQQRVKPVLLFAPPKTRAFEEEEEEEKEREKETFARCHRSIARKGVGFPAFSHRSLFVRSWRRRRRRRRDASSSEKPEKKREYDAENIPPVRARFAPKRVVVFRKRRQRRRSIVVVVVERW